jgi:hypothetical protein
MKIDNLTRYAVNTEALQNPKPGDYWHEMFCPYFIVVAVNGPKFTVLSCLSHNSVNRKDELCAKVDNMDGTWSFDYSKSMIVDRGWIRNAVRYNSFDGFVADVTHSDRNLRIVEEWIEFQTDKLLKELKLLGPHATKYMIKREWE